MRVLGSGQGRGMLFPGKSSSTTPHNLILDCQREDKLVWMPDSSRVYSPASVCRAIRNSKPAVSWFHLVWFPLHIPRWAFIQWLAFHGKFNWPARTAYSNGEWWLLIFVLFVTREGNLTLICSLNALFLAGYGCISLLRVGYTEIQKVCLRRLNGLWIILKEFFAE